MKNKIYAICDEKDVVLGVFNREEFKQLLDTTPNSFSSTISKLNRRLIKHVYFKGQRYRVFIYDEVENGILVTK